MKNLLIHDLHNFIHKHMPMKEFNEDDFYYHLMNTIKSDNMSTTASNENRYKTFSLKNLIASIIMAPEKQQKIIQSILNDKKSIISLYTKHNLKMPSSTQSDILLTELFYIALAQNAQKFARSFSNHKLKPDTFKATLGRQSDAIQLKSVLEQYHKVIVSGELGSGKSRFIKYCLTEWNINDYCYISYDNQNDIETNLHQIQYIDLWGDTYWGSKHELRSNIFSSSILIIDDMYDSPNLSAELEWLSGLSINIIVITISAVKADSFYLYELPKLPDKELLQIFTDDSGFPTSDKELQELLLEKTRSNVLLIALIAKLYEKTIKSSSNRTPSAVLQSILAHLEYPDSHFNSKQVFHYKHEYTNYDKTLDIIGHMKSVYNKAFEQADSTLHNYMKWFSCFGCAQLPLTFLSYIIPDYQKEDIDTLNKMGILSLSEDSLQLSPLVSYAAFAVELPKPIQSDLGDILNRLILFLESYDDTLSVPYLSNTLLTFTHTMYNKMPAQNNPNQTTTSKKFEKWQDLIYLIYNYYNQNGDFFIANKVISIIKYPNNLKNSHSYMDIPFFSLENNMLKETAPAEILNQTDKLYSCISEYSELPDYMNPLHFYINAFDLCLGLFCIDDFHVYYMKDKKFLIHQKELIIAMEKLICYISLLRHDNFHITKEKIRYYQLCYQLITTPEPLLNNFINCLSEIKQWKNINYRIRGTAFVLSQQSLYIYWIYINEYRLNPDCCGSSKLFEDFHVSEIFYLRSQISNCKFLPLHTFKQCLYTYINTAILQRCFSSTMQNRESTSVVLSIADFKKLLSTSILNKNEMDEAIKKINQLSDLLS